MQIHGLIVTNITSDNGPLFLASTHSIKNYVIGSTFAGNNNSLHLLITSNVGLFIISVFAVIGVTLVMMLFMLNLTVVNGNINGFIFLLTL